MDMTMDDSKGTNSSLLPMIIVGGLFFVFGFVTWLNGSLIPFLQIACELNHMEAYLVTMAFYIAYTVMALPMAAILKRTGYRNGMMLGLLVMAVGALVFIPGRNPQLYRVSYRAIYPRHRPNHFANGFQPLHRSHWAS